MSTGKQDPIEHMLEEIILFIGRYFKGVTHGVKKLNKRPYILGFSISIVIMIITFVFKGQILLYKTSNKIINLTGYFLLLLTPINYLYCLSISLNHKQKEFQENFESIQFKGRDGSYPFLINIEKKGKKITYIFKSTISIADWQKDKNKLETAMDCSVMSIYQGKSKKIVYVVTLPSDYSIPEMIIWKDEYLSGEDGVIVIGEDALNTLTIDLNKTPHIISAGETGSGKSVVLRTMLWQCVLKYCKIFMIDFKGGVEFGLDYEQYGEVITEKERALDVLEMLTTENEARLNLFRAERVKNLYQFNKKTGKNLCRIAVFIDELAELMDKTGCSKEDKVLLDQIERSLSTLARLSRATGINLFLGIQRPDAKVLPGQIKNNIPVRICGRFADKPASEIVLGNTRATDLPNIKGRFLFKVGADTEEFQAYYFDDEKMLKKIHIKPGDMLIDSENENATVSKDKEIEDIDDFSEALFEKIDTSNNKTTKNKESKPDKIINKKLEFNFDDEEIEDIK